MKSIIQLGLIIGILLVVNGCGTISENDDSVVSEEEYNQSSRSKNENIYK